MPVMAAQINHPTSPAPQIAGAGDLEWTDSMRGAAGNIADTTKAARGFDAGGPA